MDEKNSDTFCVLPWKHLTLNHYGGAQICCISRSMIRENDVDVSLYQKSLKEVFNAETIKGVRQNMLAGKPSTECQLCYDNEKSKLQSERLLQNEAWFKQDGFDIAAARQVTLQTGETTLEAPVYYQLMVSNVCNLACRMCNGESSSKIEVDPVHGAWAPGYNNFPMPKWQDTSVQIGPHRMLGVTRRGIQERTVENTPSYFIDRRASFSVPRMDVEYTACKINLRSTDYRPFTALVKLDETEIFTTASGEGDMCVTIDLPEVKANQKDFHLTIDPEDSVEVEVKSIELMRTSKPAKKNELAISRFQDKSKIVFEQPSFVFDEFLDSADSMQRLYVVGGEPFYAKPLRKIIDFLEETDNCSHIDAVFTSNATIVDDKLLAQLQKFRSVSIGLSIEGYGPVQEYIRYPSIWSEIEANIKKFASVPGVKMHVVATLQFQSALYLPELLRFCDSLGIRCGVNLVYYPDYLNILALPMNARLEAARRLEKYLSQDAISGESETEIRPIIRHLRSEEDMFNQDTLRRFMLFTNDLDRSRGQSFRDSFPDLFEFIEETGFKWTDETLHFDKQSSMQNANA